MRGDLRRTPLATLGCVWRGRERPLAALQPRDDAQGCVGVQRALAGQSVLSWIGAQRRDEIELLRIGRAEAGGALDHLHQAGTAGTGAATKRDGPFTEVVELEFGQQGAGFEREHGVVGQ